MPERLPDAATILPAGPAPAEEVPIDALATIPRHPLAQLPTPHQEARNLRAALGGPGGCLSFLIKRDDPTRLAVATPDERSAAPAPTSESA